MTAPTATSAQARYLEDLQGKKSIPQGLRSQVRIAIEMAHEGTLPIKQASAWIDLLKTYPVKSAEEMAVIAREAALREATNRILDSVV